MYADENVITIKHKVLNEVARLAFEGKLDEERDHIAAKLIPDRSRSSAAVSTKNGRSSVREFVWQRERHLEQRMTEILFR